MAKSNLSYEELLKRLEETNGQTGMAESLPSRSGSNFMSEVPLENASPKEVLNSYQNRGQVKSTIVPSLDSSAIVAPKVNDSDEELQKTQRIDNIMDLIGGLNQAGQMFASAASRNKYKPDYELFKNTRGATEQLLQKRKAGQEKLENKQKQERMDPNSKVSKSTRELLEKQLGQKLPEISYNDLIQSQLGPTIIAAKSREAALEQRLKSMESAETYRNAMLGLKQEQVRGAGDRGEVRTNAQLMAAVQKDAKLPLQSLQFGQNALHFADAMLTRKVLPTVQDLNTLAAEEAKLAVGASGSLEDRKKYQNDSIQAYEAAFKQRLSGNPQEVANANAFIKQRMDGIKTMMEGHARNLEITRDSVKEGVTSEARKKAVDDFVNKKLEGFTPKVTIKTLSSKQLEEYAIKHNTTPEKAKASLEGKGYHVKD